MSDGVALADAAPDALVRPDAGLPTWAARHTLEFNNIAHSETFIDFPVLVVLTPERIDYERIQSAGQDLRFTTTEDNVPLAYEIETWDPTGNSYVWVKVVQINASADTDQIYMYYNNPSASDGQEPQSVWSNGYQAVYHLGEPGDTYANSVAPENQGTNVGTAPGAGAVGGGRLFDGSTSHIKLNDGGPVSLLQGVSGMTATAWIQPNALRGGQAIISIGIGEAACSNSSRLTNFISGLQSDEIGSASKAADSDPFNTNKSSGVNLVEDNWYLVSTIVDVDFLHDGDETFPYGRTRGVVNDVLQPASRNAPFSQATTGSNQPACATIGSQDDANADFFAGLIDEVRISSVDRSTTWLQAQYQSMSDNDFVRFGPVEAVNEVVASP